MAADAQDIVLRPGQLAAAANELAVQRGDGTVGQPAVHDEAGIHAQRARDGEHEAQGGAALAAVGGAGGGEGGHIDGGNHDSIARAPNICAQGAEAADGGLDILGIAAGNHLGGLIREGGADEEAVRLGFRGNGRNIAPEGVGCDQ